MTLPPPGQVAPLALCHPGGMTRPEDDLHLLLGRAAAMDAEADERWDIVREVQGKPGRAAFEAALALARSAHAAERMLGLDVLAQIGYAQGRPFVEETLPVLAAACADERPEVVSSAITALGHVADSRGLAAVLSQADHPSADVRFSVAFALPSVAGDPPAAQAVETLILLSADADPDVRDWATFGIGRQLEVDSPAIRDALVARLGDPDEDAAEEAALGLALRQEPRVRGGAVLG